MNVIHLAPDLRANKWKSGSKCSKILQHSSRRLGGGRRVSNHVQSPSSLEEEQELVHLSQWTSGDGTLKPGAAIYPGAEVAVIYRRSPTPPLHFQTASFAFSAAPRLWSRR